MKVTQNWLQQYVDFPWSPEELTERLTMLGLEVEGVEKIGGEWAGIVVAQVITRDKHPNADKLSVCRVHDGQGERQIVCGAQNFQAGDKVPLILPGASLPLKPGDKEPFTIKVGKIRSVESHGMLCSHEELGIDPEAIGHRKEEGLLILRADARVGQSLAEYLGRAGSDVVYDLEVTPNRPDLNSVIGIAREIAAVTGNPLKIPPVEDLAAGPVAAVAEWVRVQLEAPDLCPRYTARVVRGVKVGPSPDWLRQALEKVGLRSINNVVDVSNYVMLETGQPLHTFDYRLLHRGAAQGPAKVVIRRATAGESFTTLDGKVHQLTPENLLIADDLKGIALAGVMGGQNSEINVNTTEVLIESAYFLPTNIRRTSKALGLRTDASYRFERGADVGVCDYASRRCAQLILATAGGSLADGVVDAYPEPLKHREIRLRHDRAQILLSVGLPDEVQAGMLESLGIQEVTRPEMRGAWSVWRVPSWRVDLKREVDLLEELARLFGVDKIPSTPPRCVLGSHPFDAIYDQLAEIRTRLTGWGLDEAQGQTLIGATAAQLVTSAKVALANPLSSDMDVLRPSLLPGLLDMLRHNFTRGNRDVQLFEIGRVFTQVNGRAREGWRVAIAMTGARSSGFWSGAERDAQCDVFDAKGVVESLLDLFGLRGVAYQRRADSTPLFVESATVALGDKLTLGELGQVHPRLAKQYDLRDPVVLAELDIDALLQRRNTGQLFKNLPAFPGIRRDVAMIVPEATTHDAVQAVVRQIKPANLETVDLFDVFRGKHVPEGQKSLAYAFSYRAADRTLKDDEVNAAHSRLVEAFKSQLSAVVRE